MPNIEITATAAVQPGVAGLKQVQSELGKTAIAAQKTDSSLAKMGGGLKSIVGSAASATSAVSGLGATLLSGGIALGVSAIIAGVIELGKAMFDLSEDQKRLNEVLEGAKSAYVKATLEVDKMKDAFEKARTGVITKEAALKLYNSTIGKTIGQTNDLDIAEKNFIANAENYIKFTLLKAAANIALGKAAEKAFNAELERIKGPVAPTMKERLLFSRFGGPSKEKLQQDRINVELKKKNEFMEIYNSLMAEAEKFSFAGIEQAEKEVKVIDKKIAKTKELRKEEEATRIDSRRFKFGDQVEPTRKTGQLVINPDILISPKSIEVSAEAQQKVIDAMNKFFLNAKIADAINATIENILNDTISTIASGIGEILAGNAGALPSLFDNLIKGIGQQVTELGKYLVKVGLQMLIAKQAIEKLGLTPQGAILAGIGLQILGSLLKAAATKKMGNTGFASGGTVGQGGFYNVGERGQERIFLPQGTKVQPNNEVNAFGGGNITLVASPQWSGDGFKIMLNKIDAKWGRNN